MSDIVFSDREHFQCPQCNAIGQPMPHGVARMMATGSDLEPDINVSWCAWGHVTVHDDEGRTLNTYTIPHEG